MGSLLFWVSRISNFNPVAVPQSTRRTSRSEERRCRAFNEMNKNSARTRKKMTFWSFSLTKKSFHRVQRKWCELHMLFFEQHVTLCRRRRKNLPINGLISAAAVIVQAESEFVARNGKSILKFSARRRK
jgi:hypothetical protein